MSDQRLIRAAAVIALSAALPSFLVGALAPRINEDMRFGATEIGIAMTVCYTVAGVLSPLGGRVVARLGTTVAARLTCALATLGLLGISAAGSAGHLVLALAVVGCANTMFQPASNSLLLGVSEPRRQAFGFGTVQGAIPVAALLSGASLAVAGAGPDWRLITLVAAAATACAQFTIGVGRPAVAPARSRPANPVASPRLAVLPLLVTGTIASAAASTLPSFTATAGHANGLSPTAIALAQIAGSLGSVAVRIAAPVAMSNAALGRRLGVVAALMAVGTVGLLLLVTGGQVGFVCGAVLGFAFGWGWNGLYNQLVAVASPGRVATTTGITQAGVFLGGTVGPAIFAVIAVRAGFGPAWAAMAVLLGIAAIAAISARPRSAAERRPARSSIQKGP
ncbi:MFS transporter [Luedemannella helvata]